MPDGPLPGYLRRLRSALGRPADPAADADLLRRWTADRDEIAFELLVRRHGPMVLGTCRRILGAGPDADDAFQAAFLALVRRAGRVRDGAAVGGWLHRTAARAALRVKARRPPPPPPHDPPARPDDRVERADLRAVLDEEIGRLPDRFREPFVLCYLQGRTNAEAARALGRPVGTVLSRLATARERLRAGLTRRGVALPAAGLAAAVPPELLAATRAAVAGPPPAAILNLIPTEGWPMAVSFKLLAPVVLTAGLIAGGVGLSADDPKPKRVAERPAAPAAAEEPAASDRPTGWGVGAFSGFAGGVDRTTVRTGKGSGVIRKTGDGEQRFATLVQEVKAEPFRGKRVRLAGYLKTKDAADGGSLWVRIDAPKATVGFDNMSDRMPKGTTDWAKHEIVLDVPKDATVLTFGVLLHGAGTVWADDLSLEAVGNDVKVTQEPVRNEHGMDTRDPAEAADKPANLGFEEAEPAPKPAAATAATAEQVKWLKTNLIPFATDAPGSDLADLAPLKARFADATIVALGEGSHGTREHFRMKHRLTEFLVKELGFTHFMIEASLADTERVNDYVLGGPGEARKVVAGMLFWTWNTEEVVELVEWLRAHNRTATTKVQFLGFDMQSGSMAVADVKAFVAKADPDFLKATEAAYERLAKYWEYDPAAQKAVAGLSADEKKANAKAAWAVAEHLDANRQTYQKAQPADAVARAVRTARAAAQAAENRTNPANRDGCMADNVKHILDRAPAGSKAVLWAHNGHVCRQQGWMGAFLDKHYGPKQVVVGFAAGAGTYTAVKRNVGLVSDNKLLDPPAGSLEAAFRSAGLPRAVLDLRAAAADPAGKWATDPRGFRSVGALAMDFQFFPCRVGDWYDLIVYFDQTTATRCYGITKLKGD